MTGPRTSGSWFVTGPGIHRVVRRGPGRRWYRSGQDPAPKSQGNAYAERFVLTARTEVTDRMLIVSERHLRIVMVRYARHHNGRRPHRGSSSSPPARPPRSRPFPGTDQGPASPRRPPQRIRASCLKAQVTASSAVLAPHRQQAGGPAPAGPDDPGHRGLGHPGRLRVLLGELDQPGRCPHRGSGHHPGPDRAAARQLELARAAPGVSVQEVDAGHGACITAPQLFAPALLQACWSVQAGRRGMLRAPA